MQKNILNRRDFFKLGGLFYLSASLPKAFANNLGERIIFSGSNKDSPLDSDNNLYTIVIDLENFKVKKIPSPINSHSFVQNHIKKNQIVGVEKWGYGMAIFDAGTFKFKNHIKLEKPLQFVGHGQFSPDGELFYVSISDYRDTHAYSIGKGFIFVYETRKFSLVDKFETFGFEPHEISFFENNKYLLVLNPGFGKFFQPPFKDNRGPIKDFSPGITIIDVKTKKLVKEILFPDPENTTAHLAKINENEYFLIGGRRRSEDRWDNKAFKLTKNKELIPYEASGTDILGIPLLSAAYSPQKDILVATSPTTNELLLWEKEKLKTLILERPQGVSLSKNGKFFVVSQHDGISVINVAEKIIIYQKKLTNCEAFGGHSLII